MSHPQRLGKYQITEVLGEGAMGVVYKAFDPDIRRTVALKTIRRQLDDGSAFAASVAARFRNEAQAAGRLSHPGIVAVYDFGEDGGVAYIAMEYVLGESLAHHTAHRHRFDDAEIALLMTQLLDALQHAHEQGVWHRDIKPANVLLTQAGRLKVADFGIARIDQGSHLTQTQVTVGTPAYMAPEQFLGTAIDQRVDIYSAGVLLYLLLTGRAVFTGTPESLMYSVVHEAPVLPSAVPDAGRPAFYDALVARALAKDPAQRYPSAAAFKHALLGAAGAPDPSADVTLVAPVPRKLPALPVAPGQAPASHAAAPAARWDANTLAQAESSLARHLGPLAAVLVRRAARECDDIGALYNRLAEQVTDPAARSAFLGQSTAGRRSGTTGARGSGTTGPRIDLTSLSGARQAESLTEPLVAQSLRLLSSRIGPIARVVVKKAAAKATRRDVFFAALADAVDDPASRDALLAELAKLP